MAAPKVVCTSVVTDTGETHLMLRDEALDYVEGALENPEITIAGHNIFYDLGGFCAEDPATFVPLVFKAFDAFRVRDTIIRQQLIDIATGNLKYRFDEKEETFVKTGYTLQDLAWRLLGRELPKEGTWRLKYALLDGVPIAEWPEEARQYSINDSVTTRDVFEAQARVAGGDGTIPTEERATREAWALWLMGTWGIRTDGEAVAKLRAELEKEQAEAKAKLATTGIFRVNGKKDMKAIYAKVEAGFRRADRLLPRTADGKPSTEHEVLEETPCPMCGGSNSVACETCTGSGVDPDLKVLAESGKGAKVLSTFVPLIEHGTRYPICPRWNALVESYRTSCSGPNMQNLPRKGGARACFIPRVGFVYGSVDYDTIELRSLAQSCLDLLGESAMAEALRAGDDLHLNLAADLLGLTSEKAKTLLEAGDKEVSDQRQLAKCFHPDTEVLTRNGWRKIPTVSVDDEVVQAIPSTGGVALEWVKPLEVFTTKHPSGKLVHLRNKGVDIRVTPDHRMLVFREDWKHAVVSPEAFPRARVFASAGDMPCGERIVTDVARPDDVEAETEGDGGRLDICRRGR